MEVFKPIPEYKDIKDMDVISMVESVENDYGMNYKLWPENDARLKELREWYIANSDEKKEKLALHRYSKNPKIIG